MIIAGLSGQVGTGKTSVAYMLREKGVTVICHDEIVATSIKKGSSFYNKVVKFMGDGVLLQDGNINFRHFFDSSTQNNKEQGELWKSIRKRVIIEISKRIAIEWLKGTEILILDCPIVFDSWVKHFIDPLIVVYADPATQTKRIQQRDGLSGTEIASRISSQMALYEKAPLASTQIDNSFTIENTQKQVDALYLRLQTSSEKKTVKRKSIRIGVIIFGIFLLFLLFRLLLGFIKRIYFSIFKK
ncbi:putative dephospho-CoA kinase [Monocercomonoides exilis]|uniref:putative dephospho-CoA kinase n=1 Tax=Monocercomonoides exilis TaxID=2049356 RepID=UPI00355A09F0|nr:putative dephospho-CoA kinase [Monocercomonoides exilis]